MKLRFLIDENLSPKTALFLRRLGYDAQHVDEVHLVHGSDRAIAEFARQHRRVIVTLDKDFGHVYVDSGKSNGVVIVQTSNPAPDHVNHLLESMLEKINSKRLGHALVVVTESGFHILES